jgi:hypothetical protein
LNVLVQALPTQLIRKHARLCLLWLAQVTQQLLGWGLLAAALHPKLHVLLR